jgi:hypothetical protein
MTQLSDLQCQATPADAALLSPEQIAELLPQIHGWVTSHRRRNTAVAENL